MYENIRVPHLGVKYVFDRGKLVPLSLTLKGTNLPLSNTRDDPKVLIAAL